MLTRIEHTGHDTDSPGFLDRLERWVNSVLASGEGTPRAVSGARTQRSADDGFCLVRLETTSGPALWFKATGAPHAAEWRITARIAERHPAHSPRLLACHESWRGWLTEEVSGLSLRHAGAGAGAGTGADAWARAAADIAGVQIAERERARVEEWLQLGCADLRVATLAARVDEFVDEMQAIFARQEKTSPPRLSRAELDATADALRRAFDAAARVPDTLVHADLNPDNVFFRDGRAVFLDWAGAFIGSPFTAIENLCGHFRRCHSRDEITREQGERAIREAYANVWRDAFGAPLIDDVLSIAPVLRYATLAMRSAGWLWQTATPLAREPLLRSLTRSMHQSARQPVLIPGH